jgi:hypothetical protein
MDTKGYKVYYIYYLLPVLNCMLNGLDFGIGTSACWMLAAQVEAQLICF